MPGAKALHQMISNFAERYHLVDNEREGAMKRLLLAITTIAVVACGPTDSQSTDEDERTTYGSDEAGEVVREMNQNWVNPSPIEVDSACNQQAPEDVVHICRANLENVSPDEACRWTVDLADESPDGENRYVLNCECFDDEQHMDDTALNKSYCGNS